MGLDIDKILQAPMKEIEQKDLERFQELGILSENIYLFDTLEQPGKHHWIKKCEYDGQSFFIFNYFFFSSDINSKNHINLEKYLQSDEPNLILHNCHCTENQKTINGLNKIKQAIIATSSEFPNISSCEFTKEVYVEGNACFCSCTFNGDFVSKHAKEDIDFIDCVFNKSFELATISQLRDINFEGTYFKQKFTMDIREFNDLNFSYTVFGCEFKLQSKQIDGQVANFTNATFKQKVSFYRKTINCRIYFEEAYFENDLTFTEAKFNDVVNLDKAKFKGEAKFHGTKFNEAILTKTTFENKADFSSAVFNEKAYFTNTIFKADADFSSATFAYEARFLNADFKGTAIFENAEFKAKADFKTDENIAFGKDANFSNATFHDNAYFNNRVFEDFVDFHETDFKKVACFYNITFKKPINFSSSIFSGASNFINAEIDFTYEELKNHIKNGSKNIDECISTANDFRDSFRLIKHAFNNKGNALDASLFHRLELYCKELELEFTLENTKTKNSENSKEAKPADETKGSPKDKNRIELFLDLITLKLYRNTSDHHTNLLRIINFMVLTIAAYGLCFYIFDIFLLEKIVANPKALVFSIILCYIAGLIVYMNLGIKQSAVVVIATLICVFYGISKYYPIFTIDFILLYLTLYFVFFYLHEFRLAKTLTYLICIFIFLSKPTLITPFIGVFTSEQAVESKFKEYAARYNENGLDDMLLDANLTNAKKDDKLDFIIKNRKTILEELECEKTLLINSKNKCAKYINEITDRNASGNNTQEAPEKPYTKALNALKYDEIMQSTQNSANLLYSFIMLLVIYSLTKTARRNSVVPS